jgi:hypothetical protein
MGWRSALSTPIHIWVLLLCLPPTTLLSAWPGLTTMDDVARTAPLVSPLSLALHCAIPAVIDGFPRTALQVDFVKLLYDKLLALHLKHADGPDEWRFPRPSFKASSGAGVGGAGCRWA